MKKEKQIKIGLGEAIARLLTIELSRKSGLANSPELAIKERDLLFDALNEIKIDLGLDCNDDGIPDDIRSIERSASTDCCRIIPANTTKSQAKDKKRRLSRRKKK